MKKLITILVFSCIMGITNAQNFQVLSGIGSDKSSVNFVTAELYKPLEHGLFYGFTDLKIDKYGYFDSYTEISKYWRITKKVSVTGQINTGIFTSKNSNGVDATRVIPVYLMGVSVAETFGKWNLTLDELYRIDKGTNLDGLSIGNGAQLTGTFLRDTEHFQISGYCDLYQTSNSKWYNKNRNSLIVQFEPQVWWKFSKRVYLGAECRISNFTDPDLGLYNYSSYCMFGFKWNLEN